MQIIIRKITLFNLLLFFITSPSIYAQTTVNPDSALQIILDELEGTALSLSQAQNYALKKS